MLVAAPMHVGYMAYTYISATVYYMRVHNGRMEEWSENEVPMNLK